MIKAGASMMSWLQRYVSPFVYIFPHTAYEDMELLQENLGLPVSMRIEHRKATQGISKCYRIERLSSFGRVSDCSPCSTSTVNPKKMIGCVDLACCLSQLLKLQMQDIIQHYSRLPAAALSLGCSSITSAGKVTDPISREDTNLIPSHAHLEVGTGSDRRGPS